MWLGVVSLLIGLSKPCSLDIARIEFEVPFEFRKIWNYFLYQR